MPLGGAGIGRSELDAARVAVPAAALVGRAGRLLAAAVLLLGPGPGGRGASPDPGGLPRYLAKSLVPLGFLLLALQGIREAVALRQQLRRGGGQS